MELRTFIRSQADDVTEAIAKAAKLLDESPRAVKGWYYGERVPRPETARKIVRRTQGRVQIQDIYRGA